MWETAIFICFAAFSLQCHASSGSAIPQLNPRFQFIDIDLLSYVAEEKSGNVAISPASVKSTLFMLLEGSEGETRNELRRALRLSPDKLEMRLQLAAYMAALQSNSSVVTLENANGVFLSDRLKPKKAFEEVMRGVYKSELQAVNFSDPVKATDSVNGWVRNKTRGLIPEIIEPMSISPTTSLVVLNALYFKASWKTAFSAQETRPQCFYRQDQCVSANTMHLYGELKYSFIDELRAHAVELPYEGDQYSAVILVPHDKDGCVTVVRDLPHVSLSRVVAALRSTDVQLSMPRFTVDFTDDLAAALRQSKIDKLFTSAAELPGVVEGESRGARVDSVIQRVQLQVTEAGTVAAAATGAVVVPLIGSSTVRLNIDRPFLFFIRDNASGVLLFEGKIDEPELANANLNKN